MNLFKELYYYLDLLVGFGAPVLLTALYYLKRVDRKLVQLFWIGAAIGLIWEIPIFYASAKTSTPIILWVRELPAHWVVFTICHTLWDGAIFVVGVFIAKKICGKPHLTGYRWCEFAIFILWGQITAFLVEFSSVMNDAWVYVEGYWWNPTFMQIGQYPLTISIQVIWLFASALFYFISIRVVSEE